MTLPASGAISLSDLRGEFGGSAPDSLLEYYRGGSLVPNTAANAGVPTSGAISLSDFYSAEAGEFLAVAGQYSDFVFTPTTSHILITFNTDGSVTVNAANSLTAPGGYANMWWTAQPSSGIGTGKYVRMVYTGGLTFNHASSLLDDTWYELTTGRSFGMTAVAGVLRTGNFTLQLSFDGSTVAESAAIVVEAESQAP